MDDPLRVNVDECTPFNRLVLIPLLVDDPLRANRLQNQERITTQVLIPLLVDDPLRANVSICSSICYWVLIPLLVDDPLRDQWTGTVWIGKEES